MQHCSNPTLLEGTDDEARLVDEAKQCVDHYVYLVYRTDQASGLRDVAFGNGSHLVIQVM
jgi:hypothetical protein